MIFPPTTTAMRLTILSLREQEILTAMAKGANNADIAEQLGISPNTVKNHKRNLIEKLDLLNCAQLTIYAYRWVSDLSLSK